MYRLLVSLDDKGKDDAESKCALSGVGVRGGGAFVPQVILQYQIDILREGAVILFRFFAQGAEQIAVDRDADFFF